MCLALFGVWATPALALSPYEFAWQLPLPQGNELRGLAFADLQNGYAVGPAGALVRTTDGGASWFGASDFTEFSKDLNDVIVLPSGALLAVGEAPGIFRSDDQGATWQDVPNPSTGALQDIEVVTGVILSAVGAAGQVLRSTNEGATWAAATPASVNQAHEQLWLDAQNGYVVGNLFARRTTNGGVTWTAAPSPAARCSTRRRSRATGE